MRINLYYIRIQFKTKKMSIKPTLFICLLLFACNGYAQKTTLEKVKFGDVEAKDFDPNYKVLDSNAQAVVLYDAGRAEYESDNEAWFNIAYTYHYRVKLLSKNAFDLATVEIALYKGTKTEDVLEKLEAATYVLENGIVIKTKVDKESIFKDKASKEKTIKKFTFPNLKEGCIIEYTYRIISPRAYNLRPFFFQGRHPVMRSEYEVAIPKLFDFVFLKGGFYNLSPIDVSSSNRRFYLMDRNTSGRSETFNYDATITTTKWSLTNLKPIKAEKYITTTSNYISKLEFQLSSLNYPDVPSKNVMSTWQEAVAALLKDEEFGLALSEKNKFLDDEVERLTLKKDSLTMAKNIFKYVKENFNCTDHSALYMEGTLKKAFEAKKGNVIEANILLTAMLKKAKINAEPILLSTRDHGYTYEIYPILNKFNYLITKATIGGQVYLLDASSKNNGFNHLPNECYNGYGRIIGEYPFVYPLSADSLLESKDTDIFIFNSEDGKKQEGTFVSNLGFYESMDLRDEIKNNNTDDFFKKIKTSFNYDVKMSETRIDSLNVQDEIAQVGYNFDFTFSDDLVYFQPLITEAYKTNPFSSLTRNYPVEMPYKTKEAINLTMEIPKGYKVDELPKSTRVSLNENEGMFEYLIQADAKTITLRCTIEIKKANFAVEDYDSLRDFYSYIVKKQSELIVFKKVK
jgi:Domain of Unknown Function with PDB structure (DUF3857)/Domain of Unknown Function with PDB structure (DUF3858)